MAAGYRLYDGLSARMVDMVNTVKAVRTAMSSHREILRQTGLVPARRRSTTIIACMQPV